MLRQVPASGGTAAHALMYYLTELRGELFAL